MKNRIVIGGEFNLDITNLDSHVCEEQMPLGYYYSSGRAALYNILLSVQKRSVGKKLLFLPDYLCDKIVQIALKTDFEIHFYKLNDALEIDQEYFENHYEKNAIVLLINYFGLQTLSSQIRYLKSLDTGICVIEDNVHSLFSMYNDSNADYRFTSFRKSVPLSDGGWAITTFEMPITSGENTFAQYKAAGGILKSFRRFDCFDDNIYLKLFEKGESLIDENLSSPISNLSRHLFSCLDFDAIKAVRANNASYLNDGLRQLGVKTILNYSDNYVPLFIPIWLENRDYVRKLLFQKQIYCPIHWPSEAALTYNLFKGEEMSAHELSIIIDQRYGVEEMDYILDTLQTIIHG